VPETSILGTSEVELGIGPGKLKLSLILEKGLCAC